MKWLWFILFPLAVAAQGPNPQGRIAVFTNGFFIGHALGIDFLRGATGYVAGPYLHIGVDDNAISNTPLRTNFITTAHGSSTHSNGVFIGQVGLEGLILFYDNITGGGGFQRIFRAATPSLEWGTNHVNHVFKGVSLSPDLDNATTLGGATKWQQGHFGNVLYVSNIVRVGFVSVTNNPGVGGGFIELRSTNGTAYTRWARFDDAYRPTNFFKDNSTNWVAGQVYKAHSVTYSAGEATIVLTNETVSGSSTNYDGIRVTNTIFFPNPDGGFPSEIDVNNNTGPVFNDGTPLFTINYEEGLVMIGSSTRNGLIRMGDVDGGTERDLLQVSSGLLELGEASIPSVFKSRINMPQADNVTSWGTNTTRWQQGWFLTMNAMQYKAQLWTNYVQTLSNFVFSPNTNVYELKNQTNIVFTNLVEEATGTGSEIKVHVHNTTGVTMGLRWPTFGAQHGYYFHTNSSQVPILNNTSLAAGSHAFATFTFFGTNIQTSYSTSP